MRKLSNSQQFQEMVDALRDYERAINWEKTAEAYAQDANARGYRMAETFIDCVAAQEAVREAKLRLENAKNAWQCLIAL